MARCLFVLLVVCALTGAARADEGGVSFWLPGQFGSFAAVPAAAGFSLPLVYYHTDVSAGGEHEFVYTGSVRAGLSAKGDLVFAFPTYTFGGKVLGGQSALGLGWAYGTMQAGVDVTLTGPKGNTVSGHTEDSHTAGTDLYPSFTLRWNKGKSNYLAYVNGDIPVGAYDPNRLANLSINHWSVDVGGGYTYLHPTKGHEVSATIGFTTNGTNSDTDYQNGVDAHLDWAASQFFSKTTHVGVVGYFYDQWTGDSGSGAVLGDFKSQVTGLGGEAGHFFVVGGDKWYAQAKAYGEFNAHNRPAGWNLWLSLAIPLTSSKAKS